jgi:NADH-quinone oxidoreductase subunit L
MTAQLAGLLLFLIPFAGALLIPLVNFFAPRAVPWLAVLFGLASSVIAFFLLGGTPAGAPITLDILPGFFRSGLLLDPLSLLPALIATWIGFLVLIYSLGYMKGEENLARYYALVLLFIGGMVGMALADNFLALFFFWEVMGVCSYQLIAFFYKDPKAAAAGAKAFLTTKIGDIGLLAAIIILAVNSGSFSFSVNFGAAAGLALPVLGLVAFGFILGAVGKSAQFPLHVWLPDAMEAPTTISALIHAATMVNAGVYLLARVSPVLALVPWSLTLVQWIGAITALLGALLAAFSNDLKRILAYSTVSQLGYMVLAVGVGAAFASQFHLFSHAIFKGLLFLCAGAVIHAIGTRDIRQMGGLYKHMPAVAITFLIGAMALLGLPFLNGFFSKDFILEEALLGGAWGPLALALIAGALTAFYALRTTFVVFWGKPNYQAHPHKTPANMVVPLLALALACFLSWLLVGPLSEAWIASGLPAPALSALELIRETFSSLAFIFSLAAVVVGFFLFLQRARLARYFHEQEPGWIRAASLGLGFDTLYTWLADRIRDFGGWVSMVWEERVMEGINRFAAWGSLGLSRLSCLLQTGDVHWNLLYVTLTLIVVLGVALW